jgi:hypothetical protein
MVGIIAIAAALALVVVVVVLLIRRLAPSRSPGLALMNNFYRDYLSNWKSTETPPRKPGSLQYSKAFIDVIDLHDKTCAELHQKVGGWGVDEDVFLDSSQIDPGLTLQSSKLALSEPRHGLVEVRLNVYPSLKDAGTEYDRTVQFSMIEEAGKWVVDDIISGSKGNLSARKEIEERIRQLKKK